MDSGRSPRGLGHELIDELRRRREYGAYFDYAGYQSIRQVGSFTELWDYLQDHTAARPPEKHDPSSIADWLKANGFSSVPHPPGMWDAFDPEGNEMW